MEMGIFSSVPTDRTVCRRATAHTGSRSSAAPESCTSMGVHRRVAPTPIRISNASGSLALRSHIRRDPTCDHINAGSGCLCSSCVRCACPFFRAFARNTPMWRMKIRRVSSGSSACCGANIVATLMSIISGNTSIPGFALRNTAPIPPEPLRLLSTISPIIPTNANTITSGNNNRTIGTGCGRTAAGTGSAVKVPDGNGGAGSRSAYANGTTMVLDTTACDAETCGADNWETPPFLCFFNAGFPHRLDIANILRHACDSCTGEAVQPQHIHTSQGGNGGH